MMRADVPITNRLAIIPARGGSKRIPRKNIRNFCGKPIIAHVLDIAKSSGIFNEIHVSTEDDLISSVVSDYGFSPPFKRPSHLASDYTPLLSVLQYVVETYHIRGQDFQTIVMLGATAVLINEEDLEQACLNFEQGNPSYPLIAIASFPAPTEWSFRLESDDNRLRPQQPEAIYLRSQDLQQSYFDTGSFAFFNPTILQYATPSWLAENMRGYVLPRHKAVDVDDEEDWQHMKSIFIAKHKISDA